MIAAFLLQASVYLVPGFPETRAWIEDHCPPPWLALWLVLASLAPYLIYAVPSGVFDWASLAKLLALCSAVAFIYVVAPARRDALEWQDGVVLAALAYPMVSGLSPMFREIYAGPSEQIPRLDILGKLMVIPLGAMAFLSLRKLQHAGFQFAIGREDLWAGIKNYLWFLPFGGTLAVGIGFVRWDPRPIDTWSFPLEVLANAVGIYGAVALAEELYFRGALQNLLSKRLGQPWAAQAIVSLLFGLSHLGRGFPNWRWAAVATVLGWFCGRAYIERRGVVAPSVTHALVVLTRRYFFS